MKSEKYDGVTIEFSDDNDVVAINGKIVTLGDGTKIHTGKRSIVELGTDAHVVIK